MAVIPIKYSLSESALHPWLTITEFGITEASDISSSIDPQGNFSVWNEIIENPIFVNEYRFSRDGKVHTNQFIEGYRPVLIITSSSISSGSRLFDDFNSYLSGSLLDGLNSGSLAWNNVTPYAAYFAQDGFRAMCDSFNEYLSGSSLSSSLMGLGCGWWKDNYFPWYGKSSYGYNTIEDQFDYETGSLLNDKGGGIVPETYISWSRPWTASTQVMYGIKAYENFSEYDTGSNLNGQSGSSDIRWTNFTGSWRVI